MRVFTWSNTSFFLSFSLEMTTAPELLIKVPKPKKEKKEDPSAPIAKKPRKKKVKGVFRVEQGSYIVVFD